MNDEWLKLIEELEREGITPKKANKMIKTYEIIDSVINNISKIDQE